MSCWSTPTNGSPAHSPVSFAGGATTSSTSAPRGRPSPGPATGRTTRSCSNWRCPTATASTPAGRCAIDERVAGLRAGADDVVAKPYALSELHARLDAVLRRCRRLTRRRLRIGRLALDLDARWARVDDAPVELTAKEFHLLALLAGETGTAVARARLAAEVWPGVRLGRSRTLDVHMSSLRAKLGAGAVVETVYGFGYRLEPAP
jgi:DNA-binding response OmpR family regulator